MTALRKDADDQLAKPAAKQIKERQITAIARYQKAMKNDAWKTKARDDLQEIAEKAWKQVRDKYDVKALKFKNNWDKEATTLHHWNWNKADYFKDVFDAKNLVAVHGRIQKGQQHYLLHAFFVTPGGHLTRTPLDPRHRMKINHP